MATHQFKLKGSWTGGLLGDGEIAVGSLLSEISVPSSLQGPGKGTNPEEMLLGAAATCYLITLGAILERRKVPVEALEIASDGEVFQDGPTLRFTHIVHRPTIRLALAATDAHKTAAREATEMAGKGCMISHALKGNVSVTVDARLT